MTAIWKVIQRSEFPVLGQLRTSRCSISLFSERGRILELDLAVLGPAYRGGTMSKGPVLLMDEGLAPSNANDGCIPDCAVGLPA
jgi:hypothetical protein